MITIADAEKLIKTLNVDYCSEIINDGGFRFKLLLDKITKNIFVITTIDFDNERNWDCVFSAFVDNKIQISGGGYFGEIIIELKEYLNNDPS